jgi:tetratricopeptide (TPR) repeat protein
MQSKPNRPLWIKILIAGLGLAVIAVILYQIPAIQNRVSWRLEVARTYARGILQPVRPLPTALPLAQLSVQTMTPTATLANPSTPTPRPTLAMTPTPTATPTPLPGRVVLAEPPYETQDINNCGPATLSMYLRWFGWEGTQKDIADLVKPIRQDRNVNVDELQYAARTMASSLNTEFRVGGTLETLKRLLAAGLPVVIEEGFNMAESYWPNDDRWAGHYLLVYGYDDSLKVFYAQDSFLGARRVFNYADLDKTWQSFNRVFLIAYPLEKQPEIERLLSEDWDPDTNRQRALDTARAETESDPRNPYAWFNLGSNLVYFERYAEAAQAYDQARSLDLPQRMLRYQFGPFFAYFHAGRIDDLLALTDYALERTPNSEEALLWRGWGLYRQGDKNAAVESFQKALEARADYGDALYALNFVLTN